MADKRVKRHGIGWTVEGTNRLFATRKAAREFDRANQAGLKAAILAEAGKREQEEDIYQQPANALEPVPQEKTIVHQVTLATGEVVELGYTIRRQGQQIPTYGDGVIVDAVLSLPAGRDGYLHEGLVFHNRISSGGILFLPSSWGWGSTANGFVSKKIPGDFQAATWREAFQKAEETAKEVLKAIMQAVEARREALKAAEL